MRNGTGISAKAQHSRLTKNVLCVELGLGGNFVTSFRNNILPCSTCYIQNRRVAAICKIILVLHWGLCSLTSLSHFAGLEGIY